ncbi:lipopolysaccharide biosynthesis protein [Parabacteroides johnsonii]|jgi:hypothetical protein|uniref:lipopolysaccharide biosynthesis protein n=1 Tax=Parabacteroides johnsonii TaxID=387661 RepID=UPI00242E1375|nr:oligosaccharide flippase family protein [Parabacteroides johnsonii]
MEINQLKVGAFLSYISIGLNNIVGLLYTPFMLRMMGQSEYGLYSLVASVVAYLTVLDFGFGNAIVRYTAKFRAEGKTRQQYEMFGMFFLLYIGVGVLALLFGLGICFNVDYLFDETMDDSELYKIRVMMLLMVFNLAFTFPMSIWGSIITAYENFVFQKLVGIVRIILNPLVMIAMLLIGYRAIGMVVVTTIFNVVTLLINYWYCKKQLKIQVHFGHFQWGFFKEVSVYSLWIFLNAIMDRIYWSTGQFILGMFKGAAVVAVYAVSIQLQSMYMSFSNAIAGVFLPKVTHIVVNGDNDKVLSDLFVRIGRMQYAVLIFVLLCFVLFGKQFVILWAGENYVDSYTFALFFLIPLTVPFIQNTGILILQARNKMRFRSVAYLFISIFSLMIAIPLSKLYGGIGCAIANTIGLTIGQIIVMNIYYYKKVHINIVTFWREIGKMSFIPSFFFVIGFFVMPKMHINTFSELFFILILFALVYIPLFVHYGFNREEQNLISVPLKKVFNKIKNNSF